MQAVALPKPVSTVSLKRGTVLEKAESFLLLAHVKNDTWIMISERAALRVKNLIEDKVQNITGDAVLNTNQETLRKLYSIAHFNAEISRAGSEKRAVNLDVADAMFETSVEMWRTTQPKNVLVRWASESGEHVNEIAFKCIIKR